jgi:hypothetical protein
MAGVNTVPFSTDLKGRGVRVLLVLVALLLPGVVTWLSSDSFQNFVSAQPWLVALIPLVIAVITQLEGELAGRIKKSEDPVPVVEPQPVMPKRTSRTTKRPGT